MARHLPVVLVGLLIGTAQTAHATEAEAPVPIRLTFAAPAGCPDREAFLDQLRARSQRIREAASDEGGPSLYVEIRITESGVVGGLTLREANGEGGHRELRGADCESLAKGLAFVAAVILDPSAVLGVVAPMAGRSPVAEHPEAPAVATLKVALTTEDKPRAGPREHLSLSLGGAFAVAVGLGPDPQFVPRAFLDVGLPAALRRASARLSFGRGFSRTADTPNGTAVITLTDVRLETCWDAWSPATFRALACGIAEGGVLSGEGRNTLDARSETRAQWDLGLGLRPTWIVGNGLALGLLVAGAVPLARYRFYFASPDVTAYRVPAWSALAELSGSVRFW